jgi:hypothetical protein
MDVTLSRRTNNPPINTITYKIMNTPEKMLKLLLRRIVDRLKGIIINLVQREDL